MNHQKGNAPLVFLIVIAVIAAAAVGYAFIAANTRTTNTDNQTANTNQANTNAVAVNTNVQTNSTVNTNVAINGTANTNTVVDTSGWETYSDPESGVTISYPDDWGIVDTDYATIGFRPLSITPSDDTWSAIYVTYRRNVNGDDLETFYEGAVGFSNLFVQSTSVEDTTINGEPAKYFPQIPGASANSALAFTIDGYVVELQMHLDQIDQIPNLETTLLTIAESVQK